MKFVEDHSRRLEIRMRKVLIFVVFVLLLAGCNLPAPGLAPQATQAVPTPTDTPVIPSPFPGTISPTPVQVEPATPTGALPVQETATAGPAATEPPPTEPPAEETPAQTELPPPPEDNRPEEAIMILQPGPGSRVTSPVLVAGIANPTFEQTLGVQLVLDDGTILAIGPALITAELGERGPFEVLVPFEISGERQAFIQVFDSSARDGGITHLSSTGVILSESGEADIIEVEPYREHIAIESPALSERVSGGVARVRGFAIASFEQSLLVEVQDAEGNIVGSQSVLVQSPEMGVPGPFEVEVPYQVSDTGPGRIAVHDLSAAFQGDVHVASVEIELAP
jgi:hypothetical protein